MAGHRLFIVGADASYAAGLPGAGQLSGHLLGYTGNAPWEIIRNQLVIIQALVGRPGCNTSHTWQVVLSWREPTQLGGPEE